MKKSFLDYICDAVIIIFIFISCLDLFVYRSIPAPVWFDMLQIVFSVLTVIAAVYIVIKTIRRARAQKQDEENAEK